MIHFIDRPIMKNISDSQSVKSRCEKRGTNPQREEHHIDSILPLLESIRRIGPKSKSSVVGRFLWSLLSAMKDEGGDLGFSAIQRGRRLRERKTLRQRMQMDMGLKYP